MAENQGELGHLDGLKETLALLPKEIIRDPDVNGDRFKSFVDALCENSRPRIGTPNPSKDSPLYLKVPADPWSCSYCHGVLSDPITLPCGHSSCKKCTLKELDKARPTCSKCRVRLKVSRAPFIRVNVLVNKICQNLWSNELTALEMRSEGNDLFIEGDFQGAIKVYDKAIKLDPSDHFVLGNRSHAYLKVNDVDNALIDSETAIKVKPDWPKGYFRRAMALQKLERHTEAFISLFQCLILEEENVKPIKAELVRILHNMIKQSNDECFHSLFQEKKNLEDDEESNQSSSSSESMSNEFLERMMSIAEDMHKLALNEPKPRPVSEAVSIQKDDFDCPLCFRVLFKPVTTPCGHTFCKMCLDRILDHNPHCPMCKAKLTQYLAERREAVDEFVNESIRRFMPDEFEEREKLHLKELDELAGQQSGDEAEIPVFVCTMTFPSIPCPLHVFEPRYRLMVRRCMESGTREFGMCCKTDPDMPYADYGTMLEIRDIQYFPDGRAVMDTVGGRRFKVLSRGLRDGYNIAKVEFIKDAKINPDCIAGVMTFHDKIIEEAKAWFQSMSAPVRDGILKHYGQIPEVEDNYWELPNGPAWIWWFVTVLPLDPHGQLSILAQSDLHKRLEGIQRIVRYLARFNPN